MLGLADRIQTITAMFGIGNAPTGSKDPFALRRAANAIVKILAESELAADLSTDVAWRSGPVSRLVDRGMEYKQKSILLPLVVSARSCASGCTSI